MSDLKPSRLLLCDVETLNFQGSGLQWGEASEELNVNLLSWMCGKGIQSHVNVELDVCIIVIEGQGEATVDGETVELRPGTALTIPKGSERSIICQSERLTYYSIHRRRPGLMPNPAEGQRG